MPVNMPYSQQFWHRYQKQAGMQEQPQQPSTNIEQQLSQIRAYAYAAEMARLAALQNQQLQRPQYAPPPVAPSRYLSTGYQSVAPSSAYYNPRSQFGATGYPQMLTPPPRPLQSTNRSQAGFANPNGYPNNGYPMPATNRMPPRSGNWNSGVQPFTAGLPSAYAQPRSLPSQPPVDPAAYQRMQRLNQISQQIQQQQQHMQALQGALQQELQQNYRGIR